MSDRVDNELRRVSTALAEVSPPKPDLPRPAEAKRKPRMLVAVASFMVVLGLGLAAGLLFGDQDPAETTAGTIPVPADHVAREVVAADLSFNEVAVFALDRGTDPLCGEGGGAAVCVVWEDDVAVFIPFSLPEGITTEVSSPSLDGRLEVELEVGKLLAVPHPAGRFTIIHRIPGEDSTRSYDSELGSSNGP